jgi:hypothetical protein
LERQARKTIQNLKRDWKKSSEKECKELYEKAKMQGEIVNNLNSLISVSPDKVKTVIEKYQGGIEKKIREQYRTHYKQVEG